MTHEPRLCSLGLQFFTVAKWFFFHLPVEPIAHSANNWHERLNRSLMRLLVSHQFPSFLVRTGLQWQNSLQMLKLMQAQLFVMAETPARIKKPDMGLVQRALFQDMPSYPKSLRFDAFYFYICTVPPPKKKTLFDWGFLAGVQNFENLSKLEGPNQRTTK